MAFFRGILGPVVVATLALAFLGAAHPGHEYRVDGVVTKVRLPVFEVEGTDGEAVAFTIVPTTEVALDGNRATAAALVVGREALVDGVENDRGAVEAKKVALKR